MRSKFWDFVESCDVAATPRVVRELLGTSYRDLGVKRFIIVTHAPLDDLRSFGVCLHNWPAVAVDHFCAGVSGDTPHPVLSVVERSRDPYSWPSGSARRTPAAKLQRLWFDRLRDLLGGGEGVSQALRSTIVNASCSVITHERAEPEKVRLYMRMANYAYQSVLALQRPQLNQPDQLTAREHELLYRATILGERPSDVAQQLGVKITTVRTLRQKANLRLEAGSQEQTAWRMLETGQLFRSGRKGRPRAR